MVIVDAHSKWPEVCTMTSISTQATISCLHDVFCRFGFPETLVSDNGTQFTSAEFQSYLQGIGTRHVRTAPYHPSSNGLAERFVQTLKSALRKASHGTSPSELPDFLLAYRNTPHATTGEAPAMLLVGRRLRTRLDLVRPSIEEKVARRQFQQSRHRGSRSEAVFSEGDEVRVRNFRAGPKWLQATVLARTGPVSYRLSVVTPRGVYEWVRHRNHIVRDSSALTVFPNMDTRTGTTEQQAASESNVPASVDETVQVTAQANGASNGDGCRYPKRLRRQHDRYGF